jgi:hypothetical protein
MSNIHRLGPPRPATEEELRRALRRLEESNETALRLLADISGRLWALEERLAERAPSAAPTP